MHRNERIANEIFFDSLQNKLQKLLQNELQLLTWASAAERPTQQNETSAGSFFVGHILTFVTKYVNSDQNCVSCRRSDGTVLHIYDRLLLMRYFYVYGTLTLLLVGDLGL